jgi:chorismate synthase
MEQLTAQCCEDTVEADLVEKSVLRCPDSNVEEEMKTRLTQLKEEGDSVGGTIKCRIKNMPVGIGDPVFDKLEARLAQAMLSLPASKSFEVGSGLKGTQMTGLAHNDEFYLSSKNEVLTKTNNSGGIQGGISNGMPVIFTVGFKPVSTVFKEQTTLDKNNESVQFKPQSGRHDPCVLPRAVALVEAMAWLVVADHILRQRSVRIF